MVEAAGLGSASLECQKLFIVQREEFSLAEALKVERSPGNDDHSLGMGQRVKIAGFAVVENQEFNTAFEYVSLHLCCGEGCKCEIGIFAVDIEQCFVIHIL